MFPIGVICGFGLLAEGPLGVVLPFLVIAGVAFYHWGISGVRNVIQPGWIWALIVGLPWYVLATISGQDSFIARQIIFENIERFFGGDGIVAKPLSFYWEHFWGQAAPWSFVAVVFCGVGVVHLWRNIRGTEVHCPVLPSDERSRFFVVSAIIWFVVIFVIHRSFSL